MRAGHPEPVVTVDDATMIAVAAAVLSALHLARTPPEGGRVVIADANRLPLLGSVLVASGVGDLTLWHLADAPRFPLRRVAAYADVLVDLIGVPAPTGPVVVTRDTLDPMTVLPGLLRAVDAVPVDRVDVSVHAACASALATVAPPDRRPRPESDHTLIALVADTATRALRRAS